MPQFSTTRRVKHAAGNMFDLVGDMERYPEFVPFCERMRVWERRELGQGVEVAMAEMSVAYKLIRERFTSRVTLDRPNLQILVEYVEGPFSHMKNCWSFHPCGEKLSDVSFSVEYEFRSRVLGLLMGAMFEAVFRRFAEAFERRADQLYVRKTA